MAFCSPHHLQYAHQTQKPFLDDALFLTNVDFPSIPKISLKITYLNFHSNLAGANELTHWGCVMHICVSNLTIISADNGLSPDQRQAIIWTNHGILLIWTLGTNFSEILSEIHTCSFKKMHLKVSSVKWWPFCLGLNVSRRSVLMQCSRSTKQQQWPLLLTWFNFNPSMNK